MISTARTLFSLTVYELKMNFRSPVWLIGLAAALFVVHSETGSNLSAWPTLNQSLYGFHEACRMVISFMVFLFAANAVLRDRRGTRGDLIFSRPVDRISFIASKWIGASLTSLVLTLLLAAVSLFRCGAANVMHGAQYTLFGLALVYSVIPAILYIGALALILSLLVPRLLVILPPFIGYWGYCQFYSGHLESGIALRDFTLYLPSSRVGLSLHDYLNGPGDYSFAGIFNPVHPDLILRAEIHTGLALLLFCVSVGLFTRWRRS